MTALMFARKVTLITIRATPKYRTIVGNNQMVKPVARESLASISNARAINIHIREV